MAFSDFHRPHSIDETHSTPAHPVVAWIRSAMIAEPVAGPVCVGVAVAALTNSIAGFAFAVMGAVLYRYWLVEASTDADQNSLDVSPDGPSKST